MYLGWKEEVCQEVWSINGFSGSPRWIEVTKVGHVIGSYPIIINIITLYYSVSLDSLQNCYSSSSIDNNVNVKWINISFDNKLDNAPDIRQFIKLIINKEVGHINVITCTYNISEIFNDSSCTMTSTISELYNLACCILIVTHTNSGHI